MSDRFCNITAPFTMLAHQVDTIKGLGQVAKGFGQLCSLGYQAASGNPKALATLDKAYTEFLNMPLEVQAENLARFATTMLMPTQNYALSPVSAKGLAHLIK